MLRIIHILLYMLTKSLIFDSYKLLFYFYQANSKAFGLIIKLITQTLLCASSIEKEKHTK